MKKLLFVLTMGCFSLSAIAQEEGGGPLNDIRIVSNETYNIGEPIIVQGYYAPSDPEGTEASNYRWDLSECEADGAPIGDPVISADFTGAPSGEDFVFPGSEDLTSEHYLVRLSVSDVSGNMYSTSAVVAFTMPSCVTGSTSFTVEPGSGIAGTGQTIFLTAGTYFYTKTSSGTQGLTNNLLVMFNTVNIQPNTLFFLSNNSTPFDLSFNILANQPTCVSETFTLNFFNTASQLVCSYTFTVNSKWRAKQTTVLLNSGLYYKGSDDKLHCLSWNGSSWNYQAINPWGGWGNIKIDGWLCGDPTVDRVFFKGKDGGLYNIFLSGGSWLLGIVGNGLFDVKSDLHFRGQELLYIANDNLIHRRWFASSQWNQQLISPQNGYQGVTAIGGLAYANNALGNIFFRTSSNTIMNLFQNSGNWFSQFLAVGINCGGDMIFDDAQSRLYYRGTDSNIHNTTWDWINGWVYNAMTSQNGTVPASNNLAHTQGENRLWFKGNDGRVYGIWLQSNGQWRIDWLNGSFTSVAGDISSISSNVFFVATSSQIGNYWFNNQGTWPVNMLNYSSPANAIGCSSLFRIGAFDNENTSADVSLNEGFDVFPNPGNGIFQVQLKNAAASAQGELINLLGERVASFSFSGNTYSFTPAETLSAGVYLLRVNADGNTYSKRLVVE